MHIFWMWGEAGEPWRTFKFCTEKSPEGLKSATFLLWRGNLNIRSSPQTSFHRFNHKLDVKAHIRRGYNSHPKTRSQTWQQAVVYGMYLYELWKLGELQVVLAHLIRSQSTAAVILDLLVWIWLPLQGRRRLIRAFMNICHQEWFLKRKKWWTGL